MATEGRGPTSRLPQRLACVGDNCVDYYRPPIDRCFAAGNALNVAVALARGGHRVDYFGAVGDDAAGSEIVDVLRGQGVGVDHVRRGPGPTSLTEIALERGERRFSSFAEGAAERYAPSAADLAELGGRRLVHVAGLEGEAALLAALAGNGALLSGDLDDRRTLSLAARLSVAFFSATADESLDQAADLARAAAAGGAGTAVVMCGARGSLGCRGGRLVALPAEDIEPVDTCGAGDSYIAAFLDTHLQGAGLEACMRAGSRAATATCLSVGASPGGGDALSVTRPDTTEAEEVP